MVIHTKEKAKIHSHEPKGARIKGSNIYTVERGSKIAGAKAAETTGKKSYRKSTVHQANVKEKGLSRFKRNVKESNTSIKTKNTNLHIAGRTGALGTQYSVIEVWASSIEYDYINNQHLSQEKLLLHKLFDMH